MYFVFLSSLVFVVFSYFFFKGEQKKRDYLERRLIAVWGEKITAELREWARCCRGGSHRKLGGLGKGAEGAGRC